jgi:hypothetical protein
MDGNVVELLAKPGYIDSLFGSLVGECIEAWDGGESGAIPPHWWAGRTVLRVI